MTKCLAQAAHEAERFVRLTALETKVQGQSPVLGGLVRSNWGGNVVKGPSATLTSIHAFPPLTGLDAATPKSALTGQLKPAPPHPGALDGPQHIPVTKE